MTLHLVDSKRVAESLWVNIVFDLVHQVIVHQLLHLTCKKYTVSDAEFKVVLADLQKLATQIWLQNSGPEIAQSYVSLQRTLGVDEAIPKQSLPSSKVKKYSHSHFRQLKVSSKVACSQTL